MDGTHVGLTPGEWNVMECLWEFSPRTGREAVEDLKKRVGWTRSTTLTMLRRMSEKGLLICTEAAGGKIYAPALQRGEAVVRETDDFLNRVYRGSVSMLVNTMVKKQALSQEEIQQLYAILKEAEEGNQ